MAIDYTSRDFASIKQELINKLAILSPELTNRNESEFAMVMIDLFAYIGDLLSYTLDRYATESFLSTAIQRDSIVKLCGLIGYQLGRPQAATVSLTFSILVAISYDVVIPALTVCYTSGQSKVYFETLEIGYIFAGQTSVSILAKQGETKSEIIGYSNDTANQEFNLSFTPLLDEIEITVNSVVWTEVDSFFDSTDISEEYRIIDETIVKVRFGNDINGMIPPMSATIFATYRVGGGTIGNVGTGTIVNITGSILDTESNIITVSVTNAAAAYDGAERETIEEARLNAPKTFVSTRAVTANDYNNLLSLFSSDLYGSIIKAISARNESVVTQVDISCWSKDEDNLVVAPSANLKAALKVYIDELSMIGIDNVIVSGTIVPIAITGDIYVGQNQNKTIVEAAVNAALLDFFNYNNLEPGDMIAESLIKKTINSVSGVVYCDITVPATNTQLAAGEMATLGTVTLTLIYLGE